MSSTSEFLSIPPVVYPSTEWPITAIPANDTIQLGASQATATASYNHGTANQLRAFAVRTPFAFNYNAVQLNCTVAGGGTLAQLSLWTVGTNGRPGAPIVVFPQLDSSTVADKIGVITARTVSPGFYFMVMNVNTAGTQRFSGIPANGAQWVSPGAGNTTVPGIGWQVTNPGAFGTLPSSWPTVGVTGITNTISPYFRLRAA